MADVSSGRAVANGSRWMGVGRSAEADGRRAGTEATRRALRGDDAKLLIVFSADTYDPAALLAGVAEAAPGVPVVGCSTRGEIAPDGPREGTAVVTAIGGPGFAAATASESGIDGRQRESGAAVARCYEQVPDLEHKVLMVLTDGFARSQEQLIRGVYSVVGAGVPLVGGAGAAYRARSGYQLHDGGVLRNGVVAAVIAANAPMGIAFDHGWRKVGGAMVVTRSDRFRVYGLDKEPALDRYLRRLNAPAEAYDDPVAFSAWAMSHPLGVQRRIGVTARNISHDVDFAERSIGGGPELVPGALVWATEGDADSILASVEVACQEAVDALDDRPPIGLLTFSCSDCKAVLGADGVQQESVRIAGRAKGAPFAGFHAFGEIARTRGVEGYHNQTLVVLALS